MSDKITGTGNGITDDGTVTMMTNRPNSAVFTSSSSDDLRYSAVFEDDGTVAYGYLLHDKRIIADVWLYNNGDTPIELPWKVGSLMPPFMNPARFVIPTQFAPVSAPDEVTFLWSYATHGVPIGVEISIRGMVHAGVNVGSKPGWCRLASKDGPLAHKAR